MRKLLILLLMVFVGYNSNSQPFYSTIVAVDAKGRTDSVSFGEVPGSTLGVDAALGEIDIFGVPYDSLDLRIIQRNTMCVGLNYPSNIDLKKDYRPAIGATWVEYSNFSFSISADTFPVYIRVINYQIELFATAFLYDNACIQSQDTFICDWSCPTIDTLFILNSSSPSTFRIYPEVITSINEAHHSPDLTIYPNPATDKFFIESSRTQILETRVFDICGHLILQTNQNPTECSLLKDGIYVVEIITDSGIVRKRLMKKQTSR